jgi:hypothetical protein
VPYCLLVKLNPKNDDANYNMVFGIRFFFFLDAKVNKINLQQGEEKGMPRDPTKFSSKNGFKIFMI